jgi:hypothetical protein
MRQAAKCSRATEKSVAAILFVAASSWFVADPAAGQIIDGTLPSLSQFSIVQQGPPHPLQAIVAFNAIVNMKQRTNPQVFADLSSSAIPGGGRLRVSLNCQQQHGSHIWSCSGTAPLTPNHYEAQFVIFFDFPGGLVNGNRSLVTLPVPPIPLNVTGTVGRFPIPIICPLAPAPCRP